jgi:NitT/TauT family transport system substrate-binding protein
MTARPLTVLMPFHTPFYAPLPAGVALGHFADEGLAVTVEAAAAFGKPAMQALLDGDLTITLSGLMRSFDLADRTGRAIVHFAEVCSRNGFFLVSRRPRPAFQWRDLEGATLLGFAEAPTPWQCLLTVLRRHGVDPARVRIERDRPAGQAVAAFRAGHGDFLEQTQPVAERLIAEGAAHLAASMGDATGPVPFTSYMTTPEVLRSDPDLVAAFTRAVCRTQRWMAGHGARDLAPLVAGTFPEIDAAMLERILSRYLAQDTWAKDPLLRRSGYDYLEQILLDGGFIARRHAYEDLVDTQHARQAMGTAAP